MMTDVAEVWLQQYREGIPAEVDVGVDASLVELFGRSCERFAALPAYTNMGVSLTFAELEHQLKNSGAKAIVVLENFAHTLQELLQRNPQLKLHMITTEVGDLFPIVNELLVNAVVRHVKHVVPAWDISGTVRFNAALREGNALAPDAVALGRDDIAFLQTTGGTTGVAKGVVPMHANMVAKVQQLGAWIARDLVEGDEVRVIPLPLHHAGALTANLVYLQIVAQVVLITNLRELPTFVDTLRHTPFAMTIGVNTLYAALLDQPGFAKLDTRHVEVIAAGGMAVQRAVARHRKAHTGVPIVEGCGLTETSPVVRSNRLDIDDWTGTIGLPLPPTEATVLDDAGRPLPPGEVGEPDAKSGAVVRIVVVPRDPAPGETELLEHCRRSLTAYKVPKIVEFRTEPLPKTNTGKMLRRELRRAA